MRTLTGLDVLDVHENLAGRMQHPSSMLARFVAYHMRQTLLTQQAPAVGAQGTFHPVIPHGSTELPTAEQGADMARLIGRGLGKAVTIQVTAGMVADMRSTYEKAMEGIEHLDEREIPEPAGFVWLDEPWRIATADGGFQVRALSWEFTEMWTLADVADTISPKLTTAVTERLWPCIRVALWRHDDDGDPDDNAPELGPVTLTHTALLPLGLRFTHAGTSKDEESANSFLGLIHLLWIYLGMEITAQHRQGIPAKVRKRVRRSIKHADVRVVLLRRVKGVTEPADGQSRQVFYSCRWPVQGHPRHAVRPADGHRAVLGHLDKHCVVCGGETYWVRPYFKGPDGLPLRASDRTIMRLAR